MRLLIAEDDKLHRSFLRSVATEVLPQLEYIEEAEDGMATLDYFKSGEFDSVILDLQMPKVTGVEVAKYIWTHHKKTKILFWSNYSDEAYIRGISRIVPVDSVYGYILKSTHELQLKLAIQGVFLGEQCVIDREVRGIQRRSRDRISSLSDFEYEALVDLCLGLTDKAMATRRKISLRSIQSRLQQLYQKLGLDKSEVSCVDWGQVYNSRTRAISIALERGLLNADSIRKEEVELQLWLNKEGLNISH